MGTAPSGADEPFTPALVDDLIEYLATYRKGFGRDGVALADGLTDAEFASIETRWSLTFPPDLRVLLERCLPVSHRFVNWRDPADVQNRLDWPADGIAFDVTQNVLWPPEWGDRPSRDDDAAAIAKAEVAKAPTLIPLQGHRYLVGEPAASGNPVLSVYQADIIFYGDNLLDWDDLW